MQNKTKIYLLLIFILALGFFLRVYNINQAPPGIFADEAENGIDAATVAQSGDFQIFYTGNNGREGLYINIMAVFFKLFGISILTFKLTSIFFGTLTVWGVFLLAMELFRNHRIALISAFLISVSFWAINFSRIGFRAIMVPAILVFSFYFLFKGLRTQKWYPFAIGGLIFGLGLHTYISFRIAPLILLAMLFVFFLTRENFLKKYWALILVFVFFTMLSAGPMLYDFFISHPEHWESRTGNISILNPEINQGHLAKTFMKTFGLALAKYNFWGDQNWRHNFPPYALLDPLTGTAFLFGLIYSLIKFFHLFAIRLTKKVRDTKLEIYTFLLVWFFAMLVPEIMGYEGNPHALRAIGTLPVVFLFSAMTLNYFLGKTKEEASSHRKIAFLVITFMLVSIGIFNSAKYHLVWAKKAETAVSFDHSLSTISLYFKTLPKTTEKIFIADEYQSRPIKFLTIGMRNISFVWPSHAEYIHPHSTDFVIVMTEKRRAVMEALEKNFPELNLEEKDDEKGSKFYILK